MATPMRLATGVWMLVLGLSACTQGGTSSAPGPASASPTVRPSGPWRDDIRPARQTSVARCGPLRLAVPSGWQVAAPGEVGASAREVCELRMEHATHGVPVLGVVVPTGAGVSPRDLLATALSQLNGAHAVRRTTASGGLEADWQAITEEDDHTHYRALAVDHGGTYLLLLTALDDDYLDALPGYRRVALDLS